MNTIGLIVLPWICGLAVILLACFLRMLSTVVRSETVPVQNVSTDPEKPFVKIGGPDFHWPGYVAYLVVISPYTWPVVWLIGVPLFSVLRWWVDA